MQFKIGDKVRMLRSSEEGVVIRIKNNLIDIETTDGFEIPVTPTDLVLVSTSENEYFRKEELPDSKHQTQKEFLRKEAILLAFEPLNDINLRVWLVNETLKDFHAVLSVKQQGMYVNKVSLFVKNRNESRVDFNLTRLNFDELSKLRFQLLYFKEDSDSEPVRELDINLKANRIFKETKVFGPNRRTGYVYELNFHPHKNDQEITESKEPYFSPSGFNKEKTIDLHAGNLGITHLTPSEIMNYQFEFFQKEFDSGISNGLTDLTVIHGVGNGVLRNMIHKYIAKNEYVTWFKDAQKDKFGYGATIIHYKD
jgi:hypothetical protein